LRSRTRAPLVFDVTADWSIRYGNSGNGEKAPMIRPPLRKSNRPRHDLLRQRAAASGHAARHFGMCRPGQCC
jgi:hypothetical protein